MNTLQASNLNKPPVGKAKRKGRSYENLPRQTNYSYQVHHLEQQKRH